ncbi:MAG: hypothetical protein AAFY15_10650 [Cyanobacteria bacterium J06648_11]
MPSNPKSASDRATDLKVRQLQQSLHRSGFVPASTHPFVKQAVLSQPQPKRRFLIKRLIAGGTSLVAAGVRRSRIVPLSAKPADHAAV